MRQSLNVAIVKGKVASYAAAIAEIQSVSHKELAAILREIAEELG